MNNADTIATVQHFGNRLPRHAKKWVAALWSDLSNPKSLSVFSIIRYFTVVSFIMLALSAVTLIVNSRHLATEQLVELVESRNTILAQSLANALRPRFGNFLAVAAELDGDILRDRPETTELFDAIAALTAGLPVVKAKIYSSAGLTVFSTQTSQIGQSKSNNVSFFTSAREGKPVSDLVHKARMEAIGGAIINRDVVETYIPIMGPGGESEGVFELYSDVTPLVQRIGETQTAMVVGLLWKFALLLAIGYFAVRGLNRLMERHFSALSRANDELDQFAYVASHDLKAPLRAIANLSEWIEEDIGGGIDDDSRKHLDLLRGRVHRMESLIDGLLQYSRAGRITEVAKPIDTKVLVEEIVTGLPIPDGFRIEIKDPLPVVNSPRLPLQQVLANLIDNAIKYHHRDDGWVSISAHDLGACYRFSVADNGPGIAPQYHQKIFSMFQTLAPRDQVEGTGIGLSLVKKLVEAQGGEITVESSEGKGACFHVTWPRGSSPA